MQSDFKTDGNITEWEIQDGSSGIENVWGFFKEKE